MKSWIVKTLFLAVFTVMLGGLSVTAAYADDMRAGCSPDVWKAQGNKANALRVRDKAYARQIIKQNDNAPGMTCYDHALALSSRLGQMFSDTYAGNAFAGANTQIFGAVYDATSGVGDNPGNGKNKALGSQYSVVLNKQLQSYASQYEDSLSSMLGATSLSFLNTFMSGISAFTSAITGFASDIDAAFSSLQSYINLVEQVLDYMGAALPAAIPAFVAMVQGYWTAIKGAVLGAINTVQSKIMGAVSSISSLVMGALGSLTSSFTSSALGEAGACSRMTQLWNPTSGTGGSGLTSIFAAAGALTGFRPITGGGIEHGTPYFDFKSLVDKTAAGVVGDDLKHEINNATNSSILSAALADIDSGGILKTFKAPDNSTVFWTKPESFPLAPVGGYTAVKSDLDNIISKM
ncbi:MAG: hypothetical protein PW788_11380 [Micavibrio sp.]|nr:hypothetical protein [Micavibrio sp.]